MTRLFKITLLGSLIASTTAHGGVYTYEIDGKKYDGNPVAIPGVEGLVRESIQRRWWYDPNYDMASINTSCSWDGGTAFSNLKASLHAPIEAGQTITAYYDTLDFDPDWKRSSEYVMSNWVHDQGPILAYMARCPGDSCVGWDPTGEAVWFKITEYGLEDGLVAENFTQKIDNGWAYYDKVWQQYRRMFGRRKMYGWQNGNQTGVPSTIPASLAPGKYLIRNEVVYFYISDAAAPGTSYQLYHQCAQLDVTGSGTKLPKDGLVAFPGAYQPGEKGLVFYEDFPKPYVFPGPNVWNGE